MRVRACVCLYVCLCVCVSESESECESECHCECERVSMLVCVRACVFAAVTTSWMRECGVSQRGACAHESGGRLPRPSRTRLCI